MANSTHGQVRPADWIAHRDSVRRDPHSADLRPTGWKNTTWAQAALDLGLLALVAPYFR
jgi:hypothetical protein